MDEKIYFRAGDGVKLMYRRWIPARPARHTPIILLHGAASNSTRWWFFVKHSRLAADRLLLRPDLRGHGESVWRGPAGMEHWCRDIAGILSQESITRVIVVGHCLGANIAMNFASRFPALCAGLVLIEPMVREAVSGILAGLRLLSPVLRVIVVLIKLFNRLGFYRRALKSVDLELLDRRLHDAKNTGLAEAVAEYGSPWRDLRVTPSVQYVNNFIEIMRPLPVSAIRCPCLVVQSSGKRITDPVLTRIVLEVLPAVDFIEVESEHWLPAWHPRRLCRLIDSWVLQHY